MKTRGQHVVSDTKGEFFLTEISLDGRMYLKDGEWILSTGILILRWPGMFEIFDEEETEKALVRWENEAREMSKGELLKKVEKAFPVRKWTKK